MSQERTRDAIFCSFCCFIQIEEGHPQEPLSFFSSFLRQTTKKQDAEMEINNVNFENPTRKISFSNLMCCFNMSTKTEEKSESSFCCWSKEEMNCSSLNLNSWSGMSMKSVKWWRNVKKLSPCSSSSPSSFGNPCCKVRQHLNYFKLKLSVELHLIYVRTFWIIS